mmetsp:Transcript_77619/g.137458  ORF Transcript_77619/g.137458 Transcript_77619/m.137458 type:complete len:481 (-) Transcript_77619:62-1504(-)
MAGKKKEDEEKGIQLTDETVIPIEQRETTHVGGRYEGKVSIATGQRDGHGKYMYPNPFFTYEGEWSNGKKHGHGILSFGDGGFYEGRFERGEINGEGSQEWPDSTKYFGQFKDGHRHGQGNIYREHSSYKGSWAWNKYSGQGELSLPGGIVYNGEFHAHKYHGQGTLTDRTSERTYTGGFKVGHFQGEGELQERGGLFTYKGQFSAGAMNGTGKGTDTRSGIAYFGEWTDNLPTQKSLSWDLGHAETKESYLLMAEQLREEAANQLNPVAADPKAAKGKKPDPKKDPKKAAEAEEEEEKPKGPELELQAGLPLPEVLLRLVDAEKEALAGESGRLFRASMYRERRAPTAEDPTVTEVVRREVRLGDQRTVYVDPLDIEASPPVSGKSTPAPPPSAGAEEPPVDEDVYIGEASVDGQIGQDGVTVIGNNEAWLLPVHLVAGIYWIRVEDITQNVHPDSLFPLISPLEVPVRVKAAGALGSA